MKKLRSFPCFLFMLSLTLTGLCFFGWHQVDTFAEELEATLLASSQASENKSEEATQTPPLPSEDTSPPSEETPPLLSPENFSDYAKYQDLAFEIGEKYAKFTSGDLDFKELSPYFMEDSDIYTALSSYSSRRYDDHDNVLIEDMMLVSLTNPAQGQIVARITFQYLVYVEDVIKTYPSDYSIYFEEITQKVTALAMN